MAEAVGGDKELHFTDVEGIIGGFRTPVFEKGISVPGCHMHLSTPIAPPAGTSWTTLWTTPPSSYAPAPTSSCACR